MAQQPKNGNRIKVVSVVWFKVLPPLFGGQKGIALFNEHLGRLAPLYCLCSNSNEVMPASYQIDASLPVSKGQFLNPRWWHKIYKVCRQESATHLILEFPYYGIAGFFCQKWLKIKLIIHAHNMEAFRFKEQKKSWWRVLYVYEKWVLKQANAIFFKTEKDRQIAKENFGLKEKRTGVIPYGLVIQQKADKASAKAIIYKRHNLAPGTKLLLFAGTLDYGPNAKAVEAIEKILIPLLQKQSFHFTIVFCGRIVSEAFHYLTRLQNKQFLYAGNVADIENYFAAADVFLNPVLSGGGVQTKVVDALQFDLNVVCFEKMAEGIICAGEKLYTIRDEDWTGFADAVVKASATSLPTPDQFFKHHDWNNIAQNALDILQNA